MIVADDIENVYVDECTDCDCDGDVGSYSMNICLDINATYCSPTTAECNSILVADDTENRGDYCTACDCLGDDGSYS